VTVLLPKVAVIGAGKVGTAFALRLQEKGYPVVAVASRTAAAAARLAAKTGARVLANAAAAREGDLVWITTPDGLIGTVAAEIFAGGGFRPGQFVGHASGALPAAILEPARRAGAAIFSLHPLQSFASPELAVARLPGSCFTFEGDAAALPLARRLVDDLGGEFFAIAPEAKPLYHAAACVASNYLVTLLDFFLALARRAGLPEEKIFPAFLPLIQGTLQNIGAVGPVAGLTGPIARGDVETIRRHKEAMTAAEWEFYRLLGLYTVDLAAEKGLREEDAAVLKKIFGEVK
jgi:predicted short-subunit dehydrogenase-like oxidoreductase (DUF2520 family)